MNEIVLNLHMHTRYSDGSGSHKDIAKAAIRAGLDAVIVTDHNVWVQGLEGYYRERNRRLLMLIGEEIHDQDRKPQKNHLLVVGANRELAALADDPQTLINAAREAGGLTYIAHPVDLAAPAFHEPNISWEAWDVQGFNGIELWNGFSEFKMRLKSKLHGLFYAFFPELIARGPHPEVLRIWDELLLDGNRTVAVGGSDAHSNTHRLGPIQRTVFPYEFHFSSVNTHLMLKQTPVGDFQTDKRLVLEALAAGRAFVANDLPASARGFRFSAQGRTQTVSIGEEIPVEGGVTLQAHLPGLASECRLIKDGTIVRTWKHVQACTYITNEAGYYRLEAYRRHAGRQRGWIFTNPIYVM
jgi:hypothetical protein